MKGAKLLRAALRASEAVQILSRRICQGKYGNFSAERVILWASCLVLSGYRTAGENHNEQSIQ
jgi:hypothetical protein